MVKNGVWESFSEKSTAHQNIKDRRPKFYPIYSLLPENEKEKLRQAQNKWAKKNLIKHRTYNLKFRKKYPEKTRAYQKKYDEKSKKNGRSQKRNWAKFRKEEILDKKGRECEECKTKKQIEIHHKRYTNNLGDMKILCRNCHKKIHRKRDDYGKLIVSPNTKPVGAGSETKQTEAEK